MSVWPCRRRSARPLRIGIAGSVQVGTAIATALTWPEGWKLRTIAQRNVAVQGCCSHSLMLVVALHMLVKLALLQAQSANGTAPIPSSSSSPLRGGR